jgi:[ribosomal protein S18]-alanine N-acetyltransferase
VSPETAIRPAAAADLPRLAELEAAAFAEPWSAGLLASELAQPGSLLLVAAAGGGGQGPLLGYACFRQAAGEAELLRVAVDPAARRRGLGRRLIAAGLERLRASGVARCHLEVRPANAAALAAYRTLGFTLCGRRRAYYRDGSDALLLQLEL